MVVEDGPDYADSTLGILHRLTNRVARHAEVLLFDDERRLDTGKVWGESMNGEIITSSFSKT
jgi:hypothetical protein